MEIKNKSLFIINVTCFMCGEEHLPFYALQRRTMVSKTNIFNISQYSEAIKGREFCNYNLNRVTVCPNCYFASGHVSDYMSESSVKKENAEPFNKDLIEKKWQDSIGKRKKSAEPYLKGLFGEKRSTKQAVFTYNLAISSCNAIMKTEMIKKEGSRNYTYALKSVFYMLIKAELVMSKNKISDAESIAQLALQKLEEIFPYLKRESSVKAAFLMGMLGLYFEKSKIVSQSMGFLQQYDKHNKVKFGSAEQKTLVISLKQMREAYESRDEFSRKKLEGFNKPFEF